jgi:tetratricopeptide (TPR) repeat protein
LVAAGCVFAVRLLAQEPEASPAALVDVLRSARDALVTASDFVGARGPAEKVIAALESTADGPAVNDILHLARIQAELEEFDAAETNYLRAIEILVVADGEYSPTLIGPYQALGRTYINARRFPEAITVLEQAQHISQRTAGLFNVEQSGIIDDMTAAQLGAGNTLEARNLQLQRLDNAVRQFGSEDPRIIPFHSHLGDYFNESRLRASAREQYEKILAIQYAQFGADDPRVLPTLRRLVEVDLLLGRETETKERLAALIENTADAPALERALALAALGDCAAVEENVELAGQYYLEAYFAMERESRSEADRLFAEPEMINFIPPLSPVDRGARSRPYLWGSIELEFDLSADGRASNVRTVEANPPEVMDAAYARRIRETHFRPKLVAGQPVPAANVRFTHYFRLYAAKED